MKQNKRMTLFLPLLFMPLVSHCNNIFFESKESVLVNYKEMEKQDPDFNEKYVGTVERDITGDGNAELLVTDTRVCGSGICAYSVYTTSLSPLKYYCFIGVAE